MHTVNSSMSDSVAWCILAAFKITSVFSRITYHIIESICEFVVTILEDYTHRGKKTGTVNVTKKVQKQKGKAAIKLLKVGCENEEEPKKENGSNANKPTVTRKNKTEDKNGNTPPISGQTFCFRGTDKVIECNLREARKVTVSFDFYPLQDQSTLKLHGLSTMDRTSDTQSETTGSVTTSDEPLLLTSSNKINDQTNESEVTGMYGSKCKGDFTIDDQNVFETDNRKHIIKHTEPMKLGVESKDRTDSINQRCDASTDKMQGKGNHDKRHPAPPVYTKQCPSACFNPIQGTAAHIDEHTEQKQGLVSFSNQTVDQKQDYEATGCQIQDSEATFDRKQNTEITFNQMQGSEATVDQKKDSEPTVDQKKRPVPALGEEKLPETAVKQKQGPKAAVDIIQDPEANVEEIQGPEAAIIQKQEPEATVNQKDHAAADDKKDHVAADDKKNQEATVDQKQDMKCPVDQKQGLESTVDQQQGQAIVVCQKQDQVAAIDQSTDKKPGPTPSVDKKQDKVGTLEQSIDKKDPPASVDIKQGTGTTSDKKTESRDPGERSRGTADPVKKKETVFSTGKNKVSAVLSHKKKGAAFPLDKKQSSVVTVDKKQRDETFKEKTGTAVSVRKQATEAPSDKKSAAAQVAKKEGLEVSVDKKQGSVVSVDEKKDSLARIDETIDKKKAPEATGSQKQGSAASVHPSTSKTLLSAKNKVQLPAFTHRLPRNYSAPSICKEKVYSKQEPGYTYSAADRKSVSKQVEDKSNLKCPQGSFRESETTQTFSKTCDKTKVFESASEASAVIETGASEILSEEFQSTSNVKKVPETSGNADGFERDTEMTRDTYNIEQTTEESKCAQASEEVEKLEDVSEVSRKDDTPELVSEVLEDHKGDKPDSKTSVDENNGDLYQESLADRFSTQKKSAESDDSSTISGKGSLNNSVSLEKGPSILIAPDVLLDPYIATYLPINTQQTVQNIGIIEEEYLQDKWNDTDKYFYDHVIKREKELGSINPPTFAEEQSDQKAVFETKDKKEENKSQMEDHKSQKSYGKIIDKYNPMTELPKYYDVISRVDSKYLLEKSEIKCYTKQEVTNDSEIVEMEQNVSGAEGLLETEQRNNERQSTEETGNVKLLAEAAIALEKSDSLMEGSSKTYEEMGARPRTKKRYNHH